MVTARWSGKAQRGRRRGYRLARNNGTDDDSMVTMSTGSRVASSLSTVENTDSQVTEPRTEVEEGGGALPSCVIEKFKLKLAKRTKEIRSLRAINMHLQKALLVDHDKVEATITKVENSSVVGLTRRVAQGEDLPVGYVDENKHQIHIRFGLWIDRVDYDRLRLKLNIREYSFVGNLARLVFTDAVLRRPSVTGTVCNVTKYRMGSAVTARPALESKRLYAVYAMTRHWMRNCDYNEGQIDKVLAVVPYIMAKKICDLNRPCKGETRRRAVRSRIYVMESSEDTADEQPEDGGADGAKGDAAPYESSTRNAVSDAGNDVDGERGGPGGWTDGAAKGDTTTCDDVAARVVQPNHFSDQGEVGADGAEHFICC
ncbi:uncharacterized protein LOC124295410 [Neodiprion lecontei]|uniref:Uncharacterized protein LOC124295410 n=2 Tax=Neodiprion TaxID=270857 RepID=A0ABM3GLZ9_NEOLC|nr:uncharacterized protein LOC124295410 [Neodiprion lecontei]